VKHEESDKNSPELLLLNFLSVIYNHSHFLAATFDFFFFITCGFFGVSSLFLQLGCFGLDF